MEKILGIDSLAIYVPRPYVEVAGDWARSRAPQGTSVADLIAKVTKGIGVSRFSVPDAHEDTATMAAMAVSRLIDRTKLDPRNIGYLAVGTETTVDQSKSMAAYVLGMLERRYRVSLSHVGCPQFQFACAGATYALESALAHLFADDFGGRDAIVVASDVSRYDKHGPAECTQGAGAVAFRVKAAPRLLAFNRRIRATVTVDERDFFRPNWSSTAVVDGQYSVDVYLRCLDTALTAVLGSGVDAAREVAGSNYLAFHTPFPRMAEYAACRFFRRIVSLRTGEPWLTGSASEERALDRAVAGAPEFHEWFQRTCRPALSYVGQVGNIYCGALYLGLATLAEALGDAREDARGRTVTLFSYGSGATGKLLHGTVQPDYREASRLVRLREDLADEHPGEASQGRFPLTLEAYHRLHEKDRPGIDGAPSIAKSVRPPVQEFALRAYGVESGPEKTDAGYRYYDFVA